MDARGCVHTCACMYVCLCVYNGLCNCTWKMENPDKLHLSSAVQAFPSPSACYWFMFCRDLCAQLWAGCLGRDGLEAGRPGRGCHSGRSWAEHYSFCCHYCFLSLRLCTAPNLGLGLTLICSWALVPGWTHRRHGERF
jgi:hypothetical protein